MMKRLRVVLKFIGLALLLLVVGIFSFLYLVSPGSTPKFKDEHGDVIVNSVAKMEYVTIGGIEQFLLVRGKNISNPILLVLHGGPGTPELPFFRRFNSELEKYYTVAYWDQRGAGKSVGESIPSGSFTVEQLVEDAHEVTAYLKKEYKKEKIFLLGHSWGSFLGVRTVSKYPNDYYAYIGTGQFGNQPKSEGLAYRYSLGKAREANDTAALNDLKRIGEFSDSNLQRVGFMNWLFTQRVYLSMFGGSTADPRAAVDVFLRPILYCKEYTIANKWALMKGNSKSAFVSSPFSRLIPLVLKTDLSQVAELKVPVYILQGKHDNLTNYAVAKEYFDLLKAPKKEFVAFDKSAHFVPFEEPEKFNSFMINRVRKECKEFVAGR